MKLSAKYVALVAPFMAENDIRYYLNGINVRPHKDGGATIAATNGHMLAVVHDKGAEVEQELILRLAKRTVCACAAASSIDRHLILKNDRLHVIQGAIEIEIQAGYPIIADAKYPAYQNVVPAGDTMKPGLLGAFNPSYIATMEKVSKVAMKTGIQCRGVTFFNSGNPSGPAVARLCGNDDFAAVIMPAREDIPSLAVPSWLETIKKVDDLVTKSTAEEVAA